MGIATRKKQDARPTSAEILAAPTPSLPAGSHDIRLCARRRLGLVRQPRPPRAGVAAPEPDRSRLGTGRSGTAAVEPERSLRRSAAEVCPRRWGQPVSRRLPLARSSTLPTASPWSRSMTPMSSASGTRPRGGSSGTSATPRTDFREIALSPDGKTLATIEDPERLRLWDCRLGPRATAVARGEGRGLYRAA